MGRQSWGPGYAVVAIVILARFVVDMRTGITLPRLPTG
jgi:hypothetical protein